MCGTRRAPGGRAVVWDRQDRFEWSLQFTSYFIIGVKCARGIFAVSAEEWSTIDA